MRQVFTLLLFSFILLGLSYYGLTQGYLRLPLQKSPQIASLSPQTTPTEITDKINVYRLSHSLKPLKVNSPLCELPLGHTDEATTDQVLANCPTCTHAALISIARDISPNEMLTALLGEDSINDQLLDENATILCVQPRDSTLSLLFAREGQVVKSAPTTPRIIQPLITTTPAPPKNFTESELWQALNEYRRSHGRSQLTQDEAVCTYARKRVQDQIALMLEKAAADYPNPEKYPLDAHAGFTADADSGLAFDLTGKNHLAENLAYWPDANTPVQIIEWGWDTSTEGHREAQLSNDWTVGCLSSQDGFFVAIFGN
jgi:uncharacterized protein YkwD